MAALLVVKEPELLVLLCGAVGCAGLVVFGRAASLLVAIPALLLGNSVAGGLLVLLLAAAISGYWFLGALLHQWPLCVRVHAALAALGGLLFISLVSHATPIGHPLSRSRDLVTLLLGLGLCAAAASWRPSIRSLLLVIGGAGLAASVVVLTTELVIPAGLSEDSPGLRVQALNLNANYLGIVLALGLVAWVGVAIERRQILWLAPILPIVVAYPRLESRSSIVLALVGLATMVLAGRPLSWKLGALAGAVALVLLVPNVNEVVVTAVLRDRATADLSGNDRERVEAAKAAIDYTLDHPLNGIGYGLFSHRTLDRPQLQMAIATHNDWLRIAAEAGLPALAVLVFLAAQGLRVPRWSSEMLTARAVLVVYLGGLFVANTLSNLGTSAGFWVLLGSVAAWDATERECA